MSIRKLTPTATVFIALGLNTLLFDILANRLLINIVSDTGIRLIVSVLIAFIPVEIVMYRYIKDDMFLFSPKTIPITKIMIFFATLLTISMTTNIFSVILEAGFKVFNLSAKPTLAVSKTTFAISLYLCHWSYYWRTYLSWHTNDTTKKIWYSLRYSIFSFLLRTNTPWFISGNICRTWRNYFWIRCLSLLTFIFYSITYH